MKFHSFNILNSSNLRSIFARVNHNFLKNKNSINMSILENKEENGLEEVDPKVNKNSFSNDEYLKSFGWNKNSPEDSLKYEGTTRLAKAYEVALDIRKFEIELYWKRSANFWLLITGISTALGLLAISASTTNGTPGLLNKSAKEAACLILSLAATILCIAWFMANKASKFWQHNWERQVDILEQELVGPLYKTVIANLGNFKNTPHYSVSEINKYSSAYLFFLYSLVSMYFLGVFDLLDWSVVTKFSIYKALIFLANLIFVGYFYKFAKIKTDEKINRLDLNVEAVIRSVNLKEMNSSSSGSINFFPKTIETKTNIEKFYW